MLAADFFGWVGLTDAVADRQTVLLGVKVIPVAAAAAVDKLGTAALLAVKVPAGQHGAARTGLCAGQTHLWDAHTHVYTQRGPSHCCCHLDGKPVPSAGLAWILASISTHGLAWALTHGLAWAETHGLAWELTHANAWV